MSVKVGTSSISTFKVGTSQAAKLYLGTDVVWTNFTPVRREYTPVGETTETVPSGATNVVIGMWCPGKGGGGGLDISGGGGGYNGRYAESTYACTGGQTLLYKIGTGGAGGAYPGGAGSAGSETYVKSGTLPITEMNSSGGGNVTNVAPTNGSIQSGGTGGAGAAAHSATIGSVTSSAGAGGKGGDTGLDGDAGSGGLAVFYYT